MAVDLAAVVTAVAAVVSEVVAALEAASAAAAATEAATVVAASAAAMAGPHRRMHPPRLRRLPQRHPRPRQRRQAESTRTIVTVRVVRGPAQGRAGDHARGLADHARGLATVARAAGAARGPATAARAVAAVRVIVVVAARATVTPSLRQAPWRLHRACRAESPIDVARKDVANVCSSSDLFREVYNVRAQLFRRQLIEKDIF